MGGAIRGAPRARAAALALALFALGAPAAALAAPAKVVVGEVNGSIGPMIESSIRAALKKRSEVELYASDAWKQALSTLEDDERGAAAELQITAIVDADVTRGGKGWEAVIRARSGANGQVLKTWKPAAKEIKKLTATIEANLWKELGAAITKAKPPKPPKTKRLEAASKGAKKGRAPAASAEAEGEGEAEQAPAKAEPKPAAEAATVAPAVKTEVPREPGALRARNEVPLEVAIGFDLFTRSFRYNDDLFGRLRPYSLGGAPALSLKLAWYPAAHATTGFAANIGLGVEASYALGLESSDSAGVKYPTSALSILGALRGRVPLGAASELVVSLGAGRHGFTIDPAEGAATRPDIPSVGYTFGRAGAEVRVVLVERLSISAALGWRQIFSAGEVLEAAWFPRGSVSGIDGALAVGWELADGVELRLGGAGQHYFFSMSPEPGDPHVAGGAVDQYFGGTFSVAWALR